jgi:hypothetical protein
VILGTSGCAALPARRCRRMPPTERRYGQHARCRATRVAPTVGRNNGGTPPVGDSQSEQTPLTDEAYEEADIDQQVYWSAHHPNRPEAVRTFHSWEPPTAYPRLESLQLSAGAALVDRGADGVRALSPSAMNPHDSLDVPIKSAGNLLCISCFQLSNDRNRA